MHGVWEGDEGFEKKSFNDHTTSLVTNVSVSLVHSIWSSIELDSMWSFFEDAGTENQPRFAPHLQGDCSY